MNKLAIVALITAASALTACSKPTTEVKPGEKKLANVPAASAAVPASAPVLQASNPAQASDPYATLKADIAKIQQFGMQQQSKAGDLQKRMEEALQKQDKAGLRKLLPEFKALVNQSNSELNAIQLHSPEAQSLRSKMTTSSSLGIEMTEKMFADNPDKKTLEALQKKLIQVQQEFMAISQDISNKIAPPQAPASAAIAAKKPH